MPEDGVAAITFGGLQVGRLHKVKAATGASQVMLGFMTGMNITGARPRRGTGPKKIGAMLDVAFPIVLTNNATRATWLRDCLWAALY